MLTGQLILGTDRRNRLFSVYLQEEPAGEYLHVYYGLELLEVVPADRQAPGFKMLVGRLHNAGVSLCLLQQTFETDPKTIRRWGRALRCRDAQELIRVLEGRHASRKFTPEIQAYVRARWPDLLLSGRYGIGKRLREEIQRVFGIELSQETLRPLLGELRGEVDSETPPEDSETIAEGLPQSERRGPDDQPFNAPAEELPCDCAPAQMDSTAASVAEALAGPDQTLWCDHLGVLMFAPALLAVAGVVESAPARFKQWLASLLLGALNIEQTKFLNGTDLWRLLGAVVRSPRPQRQALEQVATLANIEALARFNAQQINADTRNEFYFDPHTKHYTGQEKVLKGWCAAIRWADKALHSDFVHTVEGAPLYFETTDNFADLRQRFFGVVNRCRAVLQWPRQRVVSLVVDRAIFGREVFDQVLADPTLHLITWEKGYQPGQWPPPEGLSGSLVIQRARNRAEDLRSYHLQYCERPWAREPRLRQIVVRATNPGGRVIQVSILTDDQDSAAAGIIGLMFGRWVQENDFKYLDKHFGINQITSYGVTGYEELRHQVQDRQVRSAQARALQEQRRQVRAQQSRLLLTQAQGEHQERERQGRIQTLAKQPTSDEAKVQLTRWRQAQTRWENARLVRGKQIQALSEELAQLDIEAAEIPAMESRLERLIQEQMVRHDPEQKRLMDGLRVIARNLFYQALQPFKQSYNNYRDDHDQFRQLTQSSGVLEISSKRVVAHLMPQVNYPPRLRRLLSDVLDEINARNPVLPDGSGRSLRLRLGNRSEMRLSIQTHE